MALFEIVIQLNYSLIYYIELNISMSFEDDLKIRRSI